MNPVETLGLALGAGFSSGLNLYATIATLGFLERYGVIHLPASLQVLSHPWVLGIALALYVIEFLADKIPYVDTISYAVFCLKKKKYVKKTTSRTHNSVSLSVSTSTTFTS